MPKDLSSLLFQVLDIGAKGLFGIFTVSLVMVFITILTFFKRSTTKIKLRIVLFNMGFTLLVLVLIGIFSGSKPDREQVKTNDVRIPKNKDEAYPVNVTNGSQSPIQLNENGANIYNAKTPDEERSKK